MGPSVEQMSDVSSETRTATKHKPLPLGSGCLDRYSTDAPLWRAVTYYLMENSISQVLYGLSCLVRFPHQQIAEIGRMEWKRALAVVGLLLTSYSLILYVLMTEKVSYVTAVRQCSVIFVVLLGGYALKETDTKRRLIAGVVMVLGIFLIAYQ